MPKRVRSFALIYQHLWDQSVCNRLTLIKTYETNNCMLALVPLGNSCISSGIMHENSRESLVLCASQTCPNLFVMLCSPVDVMCCVRVCSHVTLAHHPVIVAYIYYHADAHLWNVYGKLMRAFSIWWQKAVALNVNVDCCSAKFEWYFFSSTCSNYKITIIKYV